jgi:hypothetical protein
MGSAPSRTTDKTKIKLSSKKIISKVPLYLSTCSYNREFNNKYTERAILLATTVPSSQQFIAKLNPGIVFYIDDIICYCNNEGGVYTYNVWITFINEIDKSFISDININHRYISEIYDSKNKILNPYYLNEFTYSNINTFGDDHYGTTYKVNDNFSYDHFKPISNELSIKYDRLNNYEASSYKSHYMIFLFFVFFLIVIVSQR